MVGTNKQLQEKEILLSSWKSGRMIEKINLNTEKTNQEK